MCRAIRPARAYFLVRSTRSKVRTVIRSRAVLNGSILSIKTISLLRTKSDPRSTKQQYNGDALASRDFETRKGLGKNSSSETCIPYYNFYHSKRLGGRKRDITSTLLKE